jgi:hypothetical protein
MSELGLLSQQYKQLHDFLRKLRRWITVIKQVKYHGEQAAEPRDVNDALANLQHITEFLGDVIPLIDESEWDEKWLAAPPLPIDVVEKIRETHLRQQSLYLKQLQKLTLHLEEKQTQLTDKEIELLDEIMLAASADVNEVFRRMMRWT